MKHMLIIALVPVSLFFSFPAWAGNIGPDTDGSKYAASETSGWLNFIPSTGDGATVADAEVTGFIWAENTGWIRLDPENCSDCGVKNDGNGNLSGYAWSEAAGWISFSCADTNTCATVDYGVKIDPSTGKFSGYAWSEALGWISFSCGNAGGCAASNYGVTTAWRKTGSGSSGSGSSGSGSSGSGSSGSGSSGSSGSGSPDSDTDTQPDPGQDSPLADNSIVEGDAVNTGTVKAPVIQPGAKLDNTGGTIDGGTNGGTITGGTLKGELDNTGGTLAGDIILAGDARVDGGTITGTLTGEAKDKAVITTAVIDADTLSNVSIGSGCKITRKSALKNPGLDLLEAVTSGGAVKTDIPFLVDDTGAEKCLDDLLSDTVDKILGTGNTEANGDGTGGITIASDGLGNAVVKAGVTSVATTDQPDAIILTATGEILVIGNGVAITLAPAPADMDGFESLLADVGADADVGEDGVVIVALPGGAKLALRFDSLVRAGAALNSIAGSPVITVEGDPAQPETLKLAITYGDGTIQKMPPFIHHLNTFRKAMEGINYAIDPTSGIIRIMGDAGQVIWQGIPGYELLDPPQDLIIGMHFEPAGDLNGDGTDDLFAVTYNYGKQPVYTLP